MGQLVEARGKLGRHEKSGQKKVAAFLAPLLIIPTLLWNVAVDPGAPSASAAACSAGVVTPLHGPKAYYDVKRTPDADAMYLGYKVTPSATVADLNVVVSVSSNDAVALAANQPNTQNHGTVNGGSSIQSYFLAKVKTQPQSQDATITVTVNDGNSEVCTYVDSIVTSKSTLKANANKIYSASISGQGSTVGLGSQVVVTVTGNTGTIGSGPDATREINLVPVSELASFNEEAWQLTDVEFFSDKTNCGSSGLIEDRLYISNQTSPSSANCSGLYSANYVFVARNSYNSSNVTSTVQAFSYIASGNLIKHTAPFVGDLSLPTLDKTSTNVISGTKPNLATTLANAPITFTANDSTMATSQDVNVTSSALTFVGETNGIDWSQFCIYNSSGVCGTSAVTVKENGGTGTQDA